MMNVALAAGAGVRIDQRDDDVHVGAAGSPSLGAVEDPFVAVCRSAPG